MGELIEEINQATLNGSRESVIANVKKALGQGVEPGVILNEGLISAMTEIGHRFEVNEAFLPEMMVAAIAMRSGLEILKPALVASNIEPAGRVVLGTVSGDIHDIGKNLVGMMMEGVGFEVHDIGVDVPPDKFVQSIEEITPGIVAMSALLTTTMINLPVCIEAITEAGLRNQVKIMVGGAPVTQEYAERIGADGYASNANQAAKLALRL